eukprot:gene6376-4582_t
MGCYVYPYNSKNVANSGDSTELKRAYVPTVSHELAYFKPTTAIG